MKFNTALNLIFTTSQCIILPYFIFYTTTIKRDISHIAYEISKWHNFVKYYISLDLFESLSMWLTFCSFKTHPTVRCHNWYINLEYLFNSEILLIIITLYMHNTLFLTKHPRKVICAYYVVLHFMEYNGKITNTTILLLL